MEVIKKEHDGQYFGYPYRVYSVNSGCKPTSHQYLAPNETAYHKNHRIYKKQNQNRQNKANSFNLLLIDDDKDLYVFSNILKREGYNTISYSDPHEAWKYFSNVSPYYFDLILTDIHMPGINGTKLYFKFKTIDPDVKILFISALDAAEELLSIFPNVEKTHFIRKPIDRKYLLSKIKSILYL